MGKPYSDLERQAIAILANGGNPANSQDTALAKYWAWKINPSNSDHKLPPASKRTADRKKDPVYLLPFGATLNASIFAKVQITKRTNTALPATAKTACNYKTLGNADQGLRIRGYDPAYVYWRTGAATSSTDRTSRVTGRTYKSYFAAGDQGYMAPFGRDDATDNEAARQKAITTAFGTSVQLITFTPEKYRA